jgi:hypothetical protein
MKSHLHLVIHGELSQVTSSDAKLLPSKERSAQEEITSSRAWRVLSGYFLRHKVEEVTLCVVGSNFVSQEVT